MADRNTPSQAEVALAGTSGLLALGAMALQSLPLVIAALGVALVASRLNDKRRGGGDA